MGLPYSVCLLFWSLHKSQRHCRALKLITTLVTGNRLPESIAEISISNTNRILNCFLSISTAGLGMSSSVLVTKSLFFFISNVCPELGRIPGIDSAGIIFLGAFLSYLAKLMVGSAFDPIAMSVANYFSFKSSGFFNKANIS